MGRMTWAAVMVGLMWGTSPARAAEPTPATTASTVFDLGEVIVTAGRAEEAPGASRVEGARIQTFDRTNLGRALQLLPGVSAMTGGARYEQRYFVRGFTQRETPLLLDGIPVYTSYRGDIDAGRFTTYDVERIEVTRGISSVLQGPGALGGVVNVVSRRPVSEREGEAGFRLSLRDDPSTNGYESWFQTGSLGGSGWWQVSGSLVDRSSFPLAGDFTPSTRLSAGRPLEDGGDRENSDYEDWRFNVKRGWLTERGDEYTFAYVKQAAEKGNPPYAGSDPAEMARFWRWPYYDKESAYLLGRTVLSHDRYLKSRLYYDTYDNWLTQFTDADYDSVAWHSRYSEYTWGGSFELGLSPTPRGVTTLALHYTTDVHRGDDPADDTDRGERFEDATHSVAVERQQRPTERLTLTYGLSLEGRNARTAWATQGGAVEEYPLRGDSAWNPMATARWRIHEDTAFHLGVARKTMFPTMFDRYSYRMGRSVPNPWLDPETAWHYEAGWEWTMDGGAKTLSLTLFHADVADYMEDVVVAPGVTQKQNVGDVDRKGVEASFRRKVSETTDLGVNYTYLSQDETAPSGLTIQGLPRHSWFVWLTRQHTKRFSTVWSVERETERLRYLDSSPASLVGLHTTANVKLRWAAGERASWELACQNLFDADYELDPGWPEAGRQIMATYRFRW